MSKNRFFASFLLLWGLLLFPNVNSVQAGNNAIFYQPVIVKGAQLPDFQGVPTNELSLWAFDATSASWRAVPFQIDERKPSGSYFGSHDGVLDKNDELVFMAKDFGDRAGEQDWIADPDSRNFPRYALALTGVEGDGNRFLYVYRAKQPTVSSYMTFQPTPAPGTVSSDQYSVGFGANGLPDRLLIPASAGGNGQDLLDRLKIRIVAKVKGFSGYTTVQISENSILVQGISLKVGPVRIIRDLIFKLSVDLGQLGSIAPPDTFYFPIFFYPYAMGVQADSVDLKDVQDLNIKIQAVRYSMDFSSAASGMRFDNPFNSDVPVDGHEDSVAHDLSAGLTYQMLTGTQGTVLSVLEVPEVGDQRQLYYWESTDGSTEDGTYDTGDGFSYGDAGFWIRGENISGILKFWSTVYFLPGNQSTALAQQFLSLAKNPFQIVATLEQSKVSVSEHLLSAAPRQFMVSPTYPNPFRPESFSAGVAWHYFLPAGSFVRVAIYDVTGRLLKQLVENPQLAGAHVVRWDGRTQKGRAAVSGMYFCRIEAAGHVSTQKFLLIR